MRGRFVPLLHHSVAPAVRAPAVRASAVDTFRGCDFRHAPTGADKSRSPAALNMLRDEVGQVRKRMGYRRTAQYPARIHNAYRYNGEEFIHAGACLYRGTAAVGALEDVFSQGRTLGGSLYLLDGARLRALSENAGVYSLVDVQDAAYVPTVVISRDPGGAGTAYEDYNLLGAGFTNSFCGTATATIFHLTDDELDDTAVTAQVLGSSGVWQNKTEGVHFSVNRTTGTVTFHTAPGVSPALGEDNVRITAWKTHEGYADRINKCTVTTLFGVNGAADRLFVSGNPDFPNRDWHSEQNDPSMFGDTCYSALGQDDSAIVGYSIVAGRLAAHKDAAEDGRNVILRTGTLDKDGRAEFLITGALQGESDLAPRAHAYLEQEPVFLTKRGVYAIAASDVTGEKYSQPRSAFLDPALTKEENLSAACCCVWNSFYLLCVNGRVYALDGRQKTYVRDEPYSSFQYEGYLLDNIPARVMWAGEAGLCFGTEDGKVMTFYADPANPLSYNDDGKAITAHWDTPYFSGSLRHDRKRFSYLSATLSPYPVTSVEAWAQKDGEFVKLFSSGTAARYFTFGCLDFGGLSLSTDCAPRCLGRRISLGPVDKTMFRLENAVLNEPFGLYDLTLEYTETGKF